MKKVLITISALIMVISCCSILFYDFPTTSEPSLAWGGNKNGEDGTHSFITKNAFNLLPEEIQDFYEGNSVLSQYSRKPDNEETGLIFNHHYYDPVTGQNDWRQPGLISFQISP